MHNIDYNIIRTERSHKKNGISPAEGNLKSELYKYVGD